MQPSTRPSRNILYVITSSDVGGEEHHLLQLAYWARNRGDRVSVCSLRERGRIGRRLEEDGFPFVTFNEAEKPSLPVMLQNARRLAALIREHEIDLVHSFLLRANVETRLAKRLSGTNCAVINSEGCINLKKPQASIWLDRLTYRWCDVVLANAGAVRDVLIRRERVPPAKIRIVYQGVDMSRFNTTQKGVRRPLAAAEPREVVIGYVGRLHPDKGVRYLIEAAAQIREVTKAFQIVIVGDGTEAAALRNLSKSLNLAHRVQFAGMQSDVVGFMRTFDILALPSLDEALPTVAIEALACGVPVVATMVGGTAEINEHGRTGFLVPPADSNRLASALLELIRDETLRHRFGQSGPHVVEERFQIGRMCAQTGAAYDAVLRGIEGRATSAA